MSWILLMSLILSSPDFQEGSSIPAEYTCDGKDVSPALKWEGAPEGTKSYVLIVDDHDIPAGLKNASGEPITVWDHWVLFNIPASVTELAQNVQHLPEGTQCGLLSNGKQTYHGPCPPDKRHNYRFKLYALDCTLPLKSGVTKAEVKVAMRGHILEEVKLEANYDRPRA